MRRLGVLRPPGQRIRDRDPRHGTAGHQAAAVAAKSTSPIAVTTNHHGTLERVDPMRDGALHSRATAIHPTTPSTPPRRRPRLRGRRRCHDDQNERPLRRADRRQHPSCRRRRCARRKKLAAATSATSTRPTGKRRGWPRRPTTLFAIDLDPCVRPRHGVFVVAGNDSNRVVLPPTRIVTDSSDSFVGRSHKANSRVESLGSRPGRRRFAADRRGRTRHRRRPEVSATPSSRHLVVTARVSPPLQGQHRSAERPSGSWARNSTMSTDPDGALPPGNDVDVTNALLAAATPTRAASASMPSILSMWLAVPNSASSRRGCVCPRGSRRHDRRSDDKGQDARTSA